MNTPLQIIKTKDIPDSSINTFINEVSEYLEMEFAGEYFSKSFDQLSFIQILGNVIKWLPLTASAVAFFSRFAVRAADDLWDNKNRILKILNKRTFYPFSGFIKSLWRVKRPSVKNLNVIIGLSVPDPVNGTKLFFECNSEEELIWYIGSFLLKVERISKVVKTENEKGQRVLGGFYLSLDEKGSFTIKWLTVDKNDNSENHEIKIN